MADKTGSLKCEVQDSEMHVASKNETLKRRTVIQFHITKSHELDIYHEHSICGVANRYNAHNYKRGEENTRR